MIPARFPSDIPPSLCFLATVRCAAFLHHALTPMSAPCSQPAIDWCTKINLPSSKLTSSNIWWKANTVTLFHLREASFHFHLVTPKTQLSCYFFHHLLHIIYHIRFSHLICWCILSELFSRLSSLYNLSTLGHTIDLCNSNQHSEHIMSK